MVDKGLGRAIREGHEVLVSVRSMRLLSGLELKCSPSSVHERTSQGL
jgi:hypothetical protein